MKITKLFMGFAIILTVILLSVSLLINPLLAIFIVCLIACMAMENDPSSKESNEKK